MKKQHIILTCLAFLCIFHTAWAQMSKATSIEEVLQSVLQNNKEWQATTSQAEAQKWQARAENNLPNPEVTYSHLWGNKEGMGFTGEFIASQSFDFPTLYAQRNRLNRERTTMYDAEAEALRQQILSQAQTVCLDLIYLNQLHKLLAQRLANAEALSGYYAEQLEQGNTNIIEVNKVNLELLNARNASRLNEADLLAKQQELVALNGGVPIAFCDTLYRSSYDYPTDFETYRLEAMAAWPELQALRSAEATAIRNITISKQQWLPGLTLGYRMNPSSGGDRYNGVMVGISIPLFANRHKVKQAKAERIAAESRLQSQSDATLANLRQLWTRAGELRKSIDEYAAILRLQDNISLLNKSLRAGQISMIEYFVNVATFYDSMENYLQLQNDYQKTLAQLYRFRL
ncbi:transporter [Parabacteroides sp. An277]|uniref:TolC family protein n=1 Tax=Parabacteroides sp. An277 TaxID=1965619 RepID=UPI000B5735D9|nr:TolC family protein [Parabacteroides sp. An277]OUO50181.1 transporter [Parabacteroides sp. An277]